MFRFTTAAIILAIASMQSFAATIDFHGAEGIFLDDKYDDFITVDGFNILVSANIGPMNLTSSGFGINASGGGDDTDQIDGGAGTAERLSLTFYDDVTITGIELSSVATDGSDVLRLHGSGFSVDVNTTGVTPLNIDLNSTYINLEHISGNGVDLEKITFEAQGFADPSSPAVPVPAAALLGLVPAAAMILRRKR